MYRSNEETKHKTYSLPIVLRMEQNGLGMTVQTLPALMYLKNKRNNDVYLKIYKKHREILKYFFDEQYLYYWNKKTSKGDQETDTIFQDKKSCFEYSMAMTNVPPYGCHAVDYYLHLACGLIPQDNSIKNYPSFPIDQVDISKFNLPKKFITLGPAYTKSSCIIKPDVINNIIDYCIKKSYEVVLIGDKYEMIVDNINVGPKVDETINVEKCINLIDKTSIGESIAVIGKSNLYVGPEGGLMHFAGLTEVPMIISHTTMHPDTRVPYRHNKLGWEVYNVTADVECRYCITNFLQTRFPINIMQKCLYDDFKCLDEITFDKFKVHLDNIL